MIQSTAQAKQLAEQIVHEWIRSGTVKTVNSLVEYIEDPEIKNEVADSPRKIRLKDFGILVVSAKANTSLVNRAVNNIAKVRETLSEQARTVILEPIFAGEMDGFSYALWPEHRPLSPSRLYRAVQKRLLAPKAFSWLRLVCEETIQKNLTDSDIRSNFVEPLEYLISGSSDRVRDLAKVALKGLETSHWTPIHTFQHSDFWLGNILLPIKNSANERNPFGFYLIDMAGALLSGYPFVDLTRFAVSIGASKKRLRAEIILHSDIIDCNPNHSIFFALSSLGQLGMNLEYMPEHRYRLLCKNTISAMDESGIVACNSPNLQ